MKKINKKKTLITGITGQDGAYLAKFLLDKGYEVYGGYRRLSTPNFWRLQYLGIFEKIKLIPMDLIDINSIYEAIKISQPDEIYHLGAQSFVGASFDVPQATAEITGLATTAFLETIRHINSKIKFYQASTSELYGDGAYSMLRENSPFRPSSPYAVAKLYAYWITRVYREAYGIFAVNGILFNHESPLRGLEFVTRKISNAVAKIYLGLEKELVLGNLDAKRDWGYAPEYVESMWLMLQQPEPDDFVIATNETHSVKEFVKEAFKCVSLNFQKYIKTNPRFKRKFEVNFLLGDYSKAKKRLNWEPKTKFSDLVKIMVNEDLNRWKKWQDGERFAFDAPFYPSEKNIINRSL
ncbi:GDP-mannose 4,6-dehydratase [Candidatus Wolfebacteria bacterium]|nr:GDP-mannose 4,6-dehydratase [Candidatus Wolfebacteria bacterium]